jgi:hypothetical protein
MENPYKFDPKEHRVVTNVENHYTKVYIGTAALYAFTLFKYNRSFLRINGNGVAAGAFAVASLPASYAYANFFLNDATCEAARINNQREGHE